MSVEIDFKFPDWAQVLKDNEQELNLFIAATVQFNRGMLFDKEGAHNGRPRWEELKFRKGQILSKRGTLRKSIAPFNPKGTPGPDGIVIMAGDTITIGTKIMSARLMNDGTTKLPGGVLRPKKAKALKIPVPQGESAGSAAMSIHKGSNDKKKTAIQAKIDSINNRKSKKPLSDKQKARLVKLGEQISKLDDKSSKGKSSEKFIFRKSVKIPARPFDDWNRQDQEELDAALMSKVVSILKKAKVY